MAVDPAWSNLEADAKAENNDPAFINEVVRPINAQNGDLLPVSALDSKEPKWEGFQDFLKGEVRFASVMKQFPTEAAGLFQACEDMAKKRYQSYVRMTKMDWSNE